MSVEIKVRNLIFQKDLEQLKQLISNSKFKVNDLYEELGCKNGYFAFFRLFSPPFCWLYNNLFSKLACAFIIILIALFALLIGIGLIIVFVALGTGKVIASGYSILGVGAAGIFSLIVVGLSYCFGVIVLDAFLSCHRSCFWEYDFFYYSGNHYKVYINKSKDWFKCVSWTPLMYASALGDRDEIITYLVSIGADESIRDCTGRTAKDIFILLNKNSKNIV